MTNWTHMAALVGEIPALDGARCIGEADLFERTIAVRPVDGRPTRAELEEARTAALRLCAACPALAPCQAWFDGLRRSRRPHGVIAGRIVKST